jgi:hypothetical protein
MTARLANVLASNLVMVSLVNTNANRNKKNDAAVLNTAMVNQLTPSNATQLMLVKTSNVPVLWVGSPMDTNLVLLVFDLLKTSSHAKKVKLLSTTLMVVATPENALSPVIVQKLTTSNVMPIKKMSGLNTNMKIACASKNLANVKNAPNHPKKPVPLKKTVTTCTDSTKSQLLKVLAVQPMNANKFQNVFQKICHVANVNLL